MRLKTGGKCSSEKEEVVLKGSTSTVASYSAVRGSLEFVSYFAVTFVSVAFVSSC